MKFQLAFRILKTAVVSLLIIPVATAAVTAFTSSGVYAASSSGNIIEDFGGLDLGTVIAEGDTVDQIVYTSFTAGSSGELLGGVIQDVFNSFSGLSLGGLQSDGSEFFFGQDSFSVMLPVPVTGFGAFFNVNLSSGSYLLNTPVGNVLTGSATYDSQTFVFAGLTSTVPFQRVTLSSTDGIGSYNIAELEYAPAVATPEPGFFPLLAAVAVLALISRARRIDNKQKF